MNINNPPHRGILPNLGIPTLTGASPFINYAAAADYVVLHQLDPTEFLREAHFVENNEPMVCFVEGYKQLCTKCYKHCMWLGMALFNDQYTLAHPSDGFAFKETFDLSRLELVGGKPMSVPSINLNDNFNPLDGVFLKPMALERVNKLRDDALEMLWNCSRAYDLFGQSPDWNFDRALRVADNFTLNAVIPGQTTILSERIWNIIQGQKDDLAEAIMRPNTVQRFDYLTPPVSAPTE